MHRNHILDQAKAFHQQRQLTSALDLYRRLLREAPNDPEITYLTALAEFELNPCAESLEIVRQRIEQAPPDSTKYSNLSYAYEVLSDFDNAEKAARKAIALNPQSAEGFYRLVCFKRLSNEDELSQPFMQLLGNAGKLERSEQRHLYFAAGKFYQDQQLYDLAFKYFTKGNEAAAISYDISTTRDLFTRIRQVFTADFLHSQHDIGNPDDTPVFIIGMPRSGSSLVERILATHTGVEAAGEISHFEAIVKRAENNLISNAQYPELLPTMNKARLSAMARIYLKEVQALFPSARHIINKNLFNFIYCGLLAMLFPNAKIIHCQRHPLDTCLSCYFTNFFYGVPFAFNQQHIADYFQEYASLMQHWQQCLGKSIYNCYYENLISNPEKSTQQLFAYCGFDWDPSCLEFYKKPAKVLTASIWQANQPLFQHGRYRFLHYLKHIESWQQQLAPLVKHYEKQIIN